MKRQMRAFCTTVFIVMLTVLAFPFIPTALAPDNLDASSLSSQNREALASQLDIDPLSRITFVAPNSSSLIDEFSFMAAVPTAVFEYGGHQYVSPVVFHTQSDSEKWLVEDWAQYLASDGGVRQAISIGTISDSSLFDLQTQIGTQIYPRLKGATSADIASKLALMDWEASSIAVFALANDSLDPLTTYQGNASHTFINDPTTVYEPSVSVDSSDPVYVMFTPPAGTGWIEGSFNWTGSGSEFFTHTLIDPGNITVDYSVLAQAYGERFYTQSPVPLYFWVPKTADGQWQLVLRPESTISSTLPLDCQIKYHRGFSQSIVVPANARWLNVSANWNKLGANLNLALVDPTGRLGQWAPSSSILSSPGLKSISLPYPMPGDWTIVVAWMDSTTQQNDVNLSWKISALPTHLQAYLESAANGAVLASTLNVPLLFVTTSSVPDATRWAAEELGVSAGFFVDPSNIHVQDVLDDLQEFANVTSLDSPQLVSSAIRQYSGRNDVVITTPTGFGEEAFAPAALSAAVHGCPVFSLCGDDNSLTTRAEETWAPYLIGPDIEIYITSRYTTRAENGWYDERIPNIYSMRASALGFKSFLEDRGAYNSTESQQVVIISSLDNIKPSFDRSLQSNFSVGRIPTDSPALASVMISKAALHRFLFSVADSVDQALVSMYAYTDGAVYVDNFYNVYTIKQVENSTDALESGGFGIESHVGYSEVFASLAGQPSFWSLSTHGTLTSYPTDPPQRPDGLGLFSMRNQDAPYGFEVSLTEQDANHDQIVNPVAFQQEMLHHVAKSALDLEAAITNIGSPIVILTACLLGGTGLPEMLMKHGAVAVMASPRTVYFQSAGLLSVLITKALVEGNTTGSSLAQALRAVSWDYTNPLPFDPADYANQQILFGDPEIRLYNTATNPHVPAIDPTNSSFGSHLPGRGVPAVAAIGSSGYLPDSLNELGIDNNYYEVLNYSAFLSLLPLRRAVLLEPGSLGVLANNMSASVNQLDEYVRSGGTLVLFGVSGNTTWMPWSVVVQDGAPGSPVAVTDATHPLVSLPNVVGSSTGYQGYFSSFSANLSVIATDGVHPVMVAGVLGYGKLALTTTYPTGIDQNATVENAALWYDKPSLYLGSTTMNEYVIWAGDRVIITLHITDLVGRDVENASVRVWLNSSEVQAQDSGDGNYVVMLPEQWTGNRSGYYDLEIEATKPGFDTMSRLLPRYMYIRPSPWLAIGIVGVVAAAIIGGWLYFRYRRGERLLPGRHKSHPSQNQERERREKEHRKKEDEKVNPSEFFGV